MVGKYKVITLCGSTRFKEVFIEAQKRLTMEGNIVISVGGYIGSSTRSEIEYALATGKAVRYLEPIPVDESSCNCISQKK